MKRGKCKIRKKVDSVRYDGPDVRRSGPMEEHRAAETRLFFVF